MELAYATGIDIEAGEYDAAVFGIGATEYHGPHLPYGSDTFIAHEFATRIAAHFPRMLVLPPVAHGVSLHHLGFPWTLSLRPETLADTIYDIGASLHAGGVRKLLVITTHDGNPAPVEIAARNLHHDLRMHVAAMLGWQGRAQGVLKAQGVAVDLDHAGQSETAAMLAIAPHLVRLEAARDEPDEPFDMPIRVFGRFGEIEPAGWGGAATRGNAADGERILQAAVNDVLPFLRTLDANEWQPGEWMYRWRDEATAMRKGV